MNIGTYFDHNNYMAFISTHTKQAPHIKKARVTADGNELLIPLSNVAANVRWCLSPIIIDTG